MVLCLRVKQIAVRDLVRSDVVGRAVGLADFPSTAVGGFCEVLELLFSYV